MITVVAIVAAGCRERRAPVVAAAGFVAGQCLALALLTQLALAEGMRGGLAPLALIAGVLAPSIALTYGILL